MFERVIYVLNRIGIAFFSIVLLTGCSSSNNTSKPVSKKDISCYTDDTSFTLKLEDGQIVEYIDSVDGKLGQEIVDILNDEHLNGISDNDEALRIMNNALVDLDGGCE